MPVTFSISLAPLPVDFKGTPQEFATAMVDRLTITPSTEWSSFIVGSVIPTSDEGPLLYDAGDGNKEWRVWDTNTGAYTYLITDGAGIKAGSIPVTALVTDLANANKVLIRDGSGVISHVGGTAGQQMVIGSGGNPEFASPDVLSFAPAKGYAAGTQSLPIDGALHKLVADTEDFDLENCYDPTNSRYTAPTNGIYFVSARVQCENSGGTASGMEIAIGTGINGNPVLANRLSNGTSVASPPGDRWYPSVSGLVKLTAGDQLEIYLSAQDGVLAGNLNLTAAQISVHRVEETA